MNSVTLIGRLTKKPELRFTAGSAKAVATFTIAVNRGFGKDDGADFFRVVVWNKQGEACANYLDKGSLVAVQGRLQNNNYETKDGEKRYSTDVVANKVEFLSKKKGNNDTDGDGFKPAEDDEDFPF